MSVDIEKLERLARVATQGDWWIDSHGLNYSPKVEQVSGGGDEPVATVASQYRGAFEIGNVIFSENKKPLPNGTRLYLQPSPNKADVPDEQIKLLHEASQALQESINIHLDNRDYAIANSLLGAAIKINDYLSSLSSVGER